MKKEILFAVIGVAGIVLAGCLFSQNRQSTEPSLTHVATLKNSQGDLLGDIYVTYIDDKKDVFSALYVFKDMGDKRTTLYKINSEGFSNTMGVDFDMKNAAHFASPQGFEFAKVYEDHFVLHLRTNDRKNVSDDWTISWNSKKGIFEIEKLSLSVDCVREAFLPSFEGSDHVLLEDVFWNEKLETCFLLTRGMYSDGPDWANEYYEKEHKAIFAATFTLLSWEGKEQYKTLLTQGYNYKSLGEYLSDPEKYAGEWKKDFFKQVEKYR